MRQMPADKPSGRVRCDLFKGHYGVLYPQPVAVVLSGAKELVDGAGGIAAAEQILSE